jgi:hypothetical protein
MAPIQVSASRSLKVIRNYGQTFNSQLSIQKFNVHGQSPEVCGSLLGLFFPFFFLSTNKSCVYDAELETFRSTPCEAM